MSKEKQVAVPDGINLELTDSGFVRVTFVGCDAPPIRLTGRGAEKVGREIQGAGSRLIAESDFDE